ncbi:MAG TPA: AAA family ATPase [Bacteroidales bacterium]|nr:AAA family ATPase [Bacteroidales bacterium]
MKLKKVRISNYRSIKDTVEIDFSQLTVFIGPNNSGKSNILWCINKILSREYPIDEIFTEKDVYRQDPARNIDVEIEFDQPYLHVPFPGAEPARVDKVRCIYKRHKEGPFKGRRFVEKHCLTKDNRVVQVLSENTGAGGVNVFNTLDCPLDKIREKTPVVYIRTDRITTQSRSDIRQTLLKSLLNDVNRDFLREDNTISMMNTDGSETEIPRKQWFDQCIEEAMITLRTEAFSRLKDTIRKSMLDYLGYELDPDDTRWDVIFKPITSQDFYQSMELCLYEEDRETPLRALGEGVQNAIILSILDAYNRHESDGFILMIEEPEMYLYPRMKRNLYKVLRNLSEKNQVIYITHSNNFVTLPDFDSVRIVSNEGNGTQVKAPDCSCIESLKDRFRNIHSTDLNEIFFSKKAILIETDYQKKVLLDYEKRLGLDYDMLGVTILDVGNKSSMPEFAELALAFDICIAMAFDKHSSYFVDRRADEELINNKLLAYGEKGIQLFYSNNTYADELRREWGENTFQKYLDKYFNNKLEGKIMSFANDPEIPVPQFILKIIDWITESERS